MTITNITMPELAFKTTHPKEGRIHNTSPVESSPFNELLIQAVEERSGNLSNTAPLSHSSLNALVEAVMTALRQAKESMGNTASLNSSTPADLEGWPLSANNPIEYAPQRANTSYTRHVKPGTHVDTNQKISPKHEGGSYDQIIKRAADKYGVDEDLIRSVIQVESSFNPKAVSPVGAKGMMQLMPATAAELGVKNPFNAEENIMGGTLYLSRLLDRYDGDIRSTLAAYNWGMGNLERKPDSAMPGETRRYVAKIMGMVDGKPMV